MNILVTGASGFLGSALIPKLLARGHKVYGLSRHPPAPDENLIPLEGDILKPNLGLEEVPEELHAIHHLAAIHRLGEDKDGSIWETNVIGTQNVLDFCAKHGIPHLYFTSTSYTQGRNAYEQSKAFCEWMIKVMGIPNVTIFKPSIVMGTPQHFYPGHFVQAVLLMVKVHKRVETIRRYIEGKIRLPILRPVFRIPGNPGGRLNLICIEDVAEAIARIEEEGTYWLVNPKPPQLKELTEWLSEIILLDLKIEPKFDPTPIEMGFQKLSNAFLPYLWGDSFQSDLKETIAIDEKFIRQNIIQGLSSLEI